VECVSDVDGHSDLSRVDCFGEVGAKIEDSRYVRDYCFICDEPIRVPRRMLGLPNGCSRCQPAYRGSPGVADAERNFWLEQYEMAELISA
jgi:hypothetical protein